MSKRRIMSLIPAVLAAAFVLVADSSAQGTCDYGDASADLDVNNVRARAYNTGSLFWRPDSPPVYAVPKEGNANALFVTSIWIGGFANGEELRFAGDMYGPWEFWPGPLDANGQPAADCSPYDRIFNVYRSDVEAFRQQGLGAASADILEWPAALGAPFVDVTEDGTYRPEDGDYPDITGDQTLWWVMNDAGNVKPESGSAPIGLEVQVTAFAFQSQDALNDATIYKYKLIYKGQVPLVDTYFGIWADPDLGSGSDDLVGSDSVLSVGYVYNGDEIDEGTGGYGEAPPALGFDIFQGPLVPAPGEQWTDPDGTVHLDSVRLPMTTFLTDDGGGGVTGSPDLTTDDPYQYMQGLWRDGSPMTYGGFRGYGGGVPTNYMFSDEAARREFWSEENWDGHGSQRTPSDRRFLMSTGPFTLQPGDVQDIIFGIVWARGERRLSSVVEMKKATNIVQEALGFAPDPAVEIGVPEGAPTLVAPADGVAEQYTNPNLIWRRFEGAAWYELQLAAIPSFENEVVKFDLPETAHSIPKGFLQANSTYFWRVRGVNPGGAGPWSESRQFTTSDSALRDAVTQEIERIVEVSIGDSGPLQPVNVWHGLNHDGYGDRYYVSRTATGALEFLVPISSSLRHRDFEIRFTESGGYGVYTTDDKVAKTPFELWDIGIDTPDNATDDVRMIPFLHPSEDWTHSEWGWATGQEPVFGYPASDGVSFVDPETESGYQKFAEQAAQAGIGSKYPRDSDGSTSGYWSKEGGVVLSGVVLADYDQDGQAPPPGTTIRFVSAKPDPPQVPALSSPGDGASTPVDVDLWWQGSYDAELQIAEDPGFNVPVMFTSEAGEPPYELRGLQSDQTYHWRARESNVRGVSAWSPVWSFTTNAAVPVSTASKLPKRFEIESIYPNPFGSSTNIRLGLPAAERVTISVFDVLGRRIATLVDEALPAGWHEISWNAAGTSSGIYFIRLEGGQRQSTRQVVRVRY